MENHDHPELTPADLHRGIVRGQAIDVEQKNLIQCVGAGRIPGRRVRGLGRDGRAGRSARQGQRNCPAGEPPEYSGAKQRGARADEE
jgi:hypothetical protein